MSRNLFIEGWQKVFRKVWKLEEQKNQLWVKLKVSTILKTSNKSVRSNVFWYFKAYYIFWKFIKYTTHLDKTQMLKKFLSRAPTRHSFFLIRHSYMSWSTRFIPLKLCVEFSIFDSVSFLLRFRFSFNKKHGIFFFKTS